MPETAGTFVAVGVSAPCVCTTDGDLNFAIFGTFAATVVFEKSTTPSQLSWAPVAGNFANGDVSAMPARAGEVYRMRCTAYTSGTVSYSVSTPATAATLASALPTSTSGLYNINALSFPKWRAALAKVRNGTGRARLLLLGDSTTAGSGAGSGGTNQYTGAYAHNYPRSLAALLANTMPVCDNSILGNQNQVTVTAAAMALYDPRIAYGAGWILSPTSTFFGHCLAFGSQNLVPTLTFSPTLAFDTIRVWYITQGAAGNFDINVDGGASLGVTSTLGALSLTSASFTVSRGVHVINITAGTTATGSTIAAIETWDTTIPAVDLIQAGLHGATAVGFTGTTNTTSAGLAIPLFTPDLTVFSCTINDSNAATNLATYISQMQTVINTCKQTGDVLLLTGAPSGTAAGTNGTLDTYLNAVRTLAYINGCGMVNIKTRWGSYAAANANMPYSATDTVHPGPLGYRDIAEAVNSALTRF